MELTTQVISHSQRRTMTHWWSICFACGSSITGNSRYSQEKSSPGELHPINVDNTQLGGPMVRLEADSYVPKCLASLSALWVKTSPHKIKQLFRDLPHKWYHYQCTVSIWDRSNQLYAPLDTAELQLLSSLTTDHAGWNWWEVSFSNIWRAPCWTPKRSW